MGVDGWFDGGFALGGMVLVCIVQWRIALVGSVDAQIFLSNESCSISNDDSMQVMLCVMARVTLMIIS